jgi:hypothetical protein
MVVDYFMKFPFLAAIYENLQIGVGGEQPWAPTRKSDRLRLFSCNFVHPIDNWD